MDFGVLPPEINSARMYAGPGSGPMLAAAAAWDGLATELGSAATSYASVISDLTSGWQGPASASMAAAAAPYVEWMTTTAAQAEQAASQAKAAAAAYETAFVMTVPPPVIAANRSLLMTLVATNILGQNTPAITATEALYGAMWAQDAAAMYGYAGASAAATALTPFTPPQQSTNPAGLAGQAAAVTQSTGTSAATNTQAMLSQLTSAVPSALQGLASPLQSTSAATSATSGLTGILPTSLVDLLPYASEGQSSAGLAIGSGAWSSAAAASAGVTATQGQIVDTQDQIHGTQGQLTDTQGQLSDMQDRILNRLDQMGPVSVLGSAGSTGVGTGGAITAGMGRAASIGALSVPQSWSAMVPEIRPVAVSLPATGLSAASEVSAGSPGSLFSETALAGIAGRALCGTAGLGRRDRVGATTRARTAPPQRSPGLPATEIAPLLRELADLRDSGILTDEEFSEQKQRVLGR